MKDKLSWISRLKLCWFILSKGTTKDLPLYRTRHEEEQWKICRQRDKELAAACRPRTQPTKLGYCTYTDFFEVDDRPSKENEFWDKHDTTSENGGV